METLEENLRRFFEILDTEEETSSGRRFRPVYISSCRVMLTQELGQILTILKKQIGYETHKHTDTGYTGTPTR